jgi:hypothetical protein
MELYAGRQERLEIRFAGETGFDNHAMGASQLAMDHAGVTRGFYAGCAEELQKVRAVKR